MSRHSIPNVAPVAPAASRSRTALRTGRVALLGTATLLAGLAGCANTAPAGAPGSASPAAPAASPSSWQSHAPSAGPGAPATSPATSQPSGSTNPPTGGSSAPTLIRYDNQTRPEIELKRPSDVAELTGAPQSFKDYLAGLLAKKSDCQFGLTIGVQRIRTDGFAVGGVTECGGHAAVWAVVNGRWQEAIGTQDGWHCGDLKKYRVPDSLVGTQCYDAQQRKEVAYHQA